MNPENKRFWDKSTTLLVISNIVTIVFAIIEHWDLNTVLWIYWFQSVIIGYFGYVRILKFENPEGQDFTIYELFLKSIETSKKRDSKGFLLFYGWFQAGYLIVLVNISYLQIKEQIINFNYLVLISLISIIVSIVTFYFNHRTSFNLNHEEDLKGGISTNELMLIPIARIIPMHIILGFAVITVSGDKGFVIGFWTFVVVFFLIMKTIADVIMHKIEHNYLQRNRITFNPEMIIKN